MDALLHSVAETIRDYREGEIPVPTPEHVGRWLAQFDADDRPTILAELDAILKKVYFPRERVKEGVRRFVAETLLAGRAVSDVLPYLRFLDIQTRGESQRALLQIVDEILREEHGAALAACGTASETSYVYLDDAVYTGNRLRYDLTESADGAAPAWLTRTAPDGCHLAVFVLLCHRTGWEYALRHAEREADRKGITLLPAYTHLIDNRRQSDSKAQCLWPEPYSGDPAVDRYVAGLGGASPVNAPPADLFREPGTPAVETLFSSAESRRVVEGAFLRVGARLSGPRPKPRHLRPLGYEVIDSLGFGTLAVMYRNISNACPLALWWSQADVWYPLFPRRVNDGR